VNTLKVYDLPHEGAIPLGQKYIILSNDVAYLTHNIHKFPSKFIPHIPRWAILRYLREKRQKKILDPMCGSGTTLVEGRLAGHDVYGIDIDPLARLITKVKITPLDETKLKAICSEVIKGIETKEKGRFLPSIPTLHHWFREDVIQDLSIIRDTIEKYKDLKDIYDFLIVTFSSIIRKVSNADNESQKTYVSHTNPKQPVPAKPEFISHLTNYADRIIQFSKKITPGTRYRVFDNADARNVDEVFKKENCQIDLAITSPPYIKAVDYIYTQMAEYFWIGDLFSLADQKSQNEYKRKYIGTKMVYSSEYSQLKLTGFPSIDPLIEKIYRKNKKFAYITYKFFNDMRSNLRSMHKVLNDDAHYIVVVGDCNVAGEYIPVHNIIVDIANSEGYTLSNMFYYKIRNRYMRFPRKGRGGLIEHDWVLDFVKQ
jgi:hypothetical protein